jgi:hypothetical protein
LRLTVIVGVTRLFLIRRGQSDIQFLHILNFTQLLCIDTWKLYEYIG